MKTIKEKALITWLINEKEENARDCIKNVSSLIDNTFEFNNDEFLVLTDKEATDKAFEYIRESVWAFNSDFIIAHCSCLDYNAASEKIIKVLQEQCESGNDAMIKLIDNMEEFINDAIDLDGRGHFISFYDGVENEIKYNGEWFYIYQVN